MPTLEDTVEFKAITLNDLLEADAQSGVSPIGSDDSKYRLWFMVSSASAAIFAILFVVVLVTGGKGGGGTGTGKAVKLTGDLKPFAASAAGELPAGLGPNEEVSLLKDGKVLVSGVKVIGVRSGPKDYQGTPSKIVDVAVNPAQQLKLAAVKQPFAIQPGALPLSDDIATTTTAPTGPPAGESPTPAPATAPNG
jgi:hypothetical protein